MKECTTAPLLPQLMERETTLESTLTGWLTASDFQFPQPLPTATSAKKQKFVSNE